jgi:hemerythrin-like domain-containing protein
MTSPTRILREEHQVILRALSLLEGAAARLESGGALAGEGWWEGLLAWLRDFADRNHHAKEEEHLFPALGQAGVPAEGGPVGVMLEEHTEGRALVRAMAERGGPARAEAARRYVRLLRAHIDKEDEVLFPLAEAVLDSPTQALVARHFEKVLAEQGPAASIAGAEAALDRLAADLG